MLIKDLKKLVKELRKLGVTEYQSGEVTLKLAPEAPKSTPRKVEVTQDIDEIPNDGPSAEELLYWSSGGVPVQEN